MSVPSQLLVCAIWITLLSCSPRPEADVPVLPGNGTEHLVGLKLGAHSNQDVASGAEQRALPDLETFKPVKNVDTPRIDEFILANGLKVIMVHGRSQPDVTMQLAIRAGHRNATRDKVGIAELAASSLLRGGRTAKNIPVTQAIASVGGELSIQIDYENTLISCRVMSKDAPLCLSLLTSMVGRPSFVAGDVEIERKRMIQNVLNRRAQAAELADVHFQHALWGADHPRGWPLSATTLKAISLDDLRRWHDHWFRPSNTVLAVSADDTSKALRSKLTSTFRRWKSDRRLQAKSYETPLQKGIKVILVDLPGETTSHIRLGRFGIAQSNLDRFALTLVNEVLGGDTEDSLLSKVSNAKSKRKASSHLEQHSEYGALWIKAETNTANTLSAIQNILDQLSLLSKEGIDEDGLQNSLANLSRQHSKTLDSAPRFANAFLRAELDGLPRSHVGSYGAHLADVTLEEARAVAKKFFSSNDLVVVVVGDASEIEDEFTGHGWTYTKLSSWQPVATWERSAKDDQPVSKAEMQKAQKILSMAMEAKGLKQDQIKTLSWTGKAILDSPQGKVPATVKKRLQEPKRMRLDMSIGENQVEVTSVVTETKGWVRQKTGKKEELLDLAIAEAALLRAQVWRDPDLVLTRFLENETQAQHLGIRSFHGKAAHVIRLSHKSDQVTLFVAKKGLMLLGMEYSERQLKAKERYSDYRRVKGIKIAHKRAASSAESDLNFAIQDVAINKKLSPLVFLKPSGTLKPKLSK